MYPNFNGREGGGGKKTSSLQILFYLKISYEYFAQLYAITVFIVSDNDVSDADASTAGPYSLLIFVIRMSCFICFFFFFLYLKNCHFQMYSSSFYFIFMCGYSHKMRPEKMTAFGK